MKKQRYLTIAQFAADAAKRLHKYGSIRRSTLPEVTLTEHHWLIKHAPSVAANTRCPGAPDDWVEATDRPASAKRPAIREVWVGSRSMACIGDDDTPEGFQASSAQQEDAAELTDLQTMLYQDQERYKEYVHDLVEERVASAFDLSGRTLTPAQLNRARKIARVQVMIETKNMGFIDDPETGEYRPVRNGDLIQVAWGSNENLDALYLEEPSDPRSEEGSLYRELLRDQIRANSDFEQDMLNDPTISIPSQDDEFADNDLHLRRVAYYKAERIIARSPHVPADEIRAESLKRVRAGHGALRSVDGTVVSGQFNRPKDIWDENEFQLRRLEECLRHNRVKARPAKLDWNSLRPLPAKLQRSAMVKALAQEAQRRQVRDHELQLEAKAKIKAYRMAQIPEAKARLAHAREQRKLLTVA